MWWFLLVPVVWVIITKIIWHKEVNFQECLIHVGSVGIITACILGIGYYSTTSDTLIKHGYVLEKVRDNDSHMESYSCNCRQYCSGSGNSRSCSTRCDTCWRKIYTVEWYLKTTLGNIQIDYEESRSSSVWNTPDPANYVQAYVGEPCAQEESFKNYVKASPNSLFNNSNYKVDPKQTAPAYPRVHSIYKVNNVINSGTLVDLKPYEDLLSEQLKTLGAKKQVNINLIFVNITDKNYKYVVERQWIGGKKNDVVIIIGTTDNKTVLWADGFTFGLSQGNHLMLTQIFDDLRGKELQPEYVVGTITKYVDESFKRKPMEDFKYLANSIELSTGWIIFLSIFQLASNIGISVWSIRNGI